MDARIPCSNDTKRQLWDLKKGPDDTYEAVVSRLLDAYRDDGDRRD